MIKIMIVEDEPAALRYLKSIIEKKCCGFEIVGTAENGAEGLEKIRLLRPDIVITDIKMGVMDGIELAAHIKREFPSIYSVIVSGYQEFEYAKGALKCGVVDYLLKPVNPVQLCSLLDNLIEKINREYREKREKLFSKVLKGVNIQSSEIEKYIPFKYYSAAILRKNGLPSRFSSKHGLVYDATTLEVSIAYLKKEDNNIWIIPGRDEQELIFFHTTDSLNDNAIEKYVEEISTKLGNGYYTTIFSKELFRLLDANKVIASLQRMLDNGIIIGLSQRIKVSEMVPGSADKRASFDGTLSNKIGFLLSNAMYEELKQEFARLFKVWEKERSTQLWVENNLRKMLFFIETHSAAPNKDQNYDIEFLLDEAFYYSTSLSELLTYVWEIVERITGRVEKKKNKIDTLEFFKSIKQYMNQNLSEQLSLQSVCLAFNISQTYLSRLFRKYEKMSFNEYLTSTRIEKAKQIMEENTSLPLKEVALFVGYIDQFYFSRVFKSVTGMPPSEYAASIQDS